MSPRPPILLGRGASLGPACVFCGRPARHRVTMAFSDASGNTVVLLGTIGALISYRRIDFHAAVCPRHRAARRRWAVVSAVFAMTATAALAAALWSLTREPADDPAASALGVTGLVLTIAAAVTFMLMPRLTNRGVTASHVEIGGVHPRAAPVGSSVLTPAPPGTPRPSPSPRSSGSS